MTGTTDPGRYDCSHCCPTLAMYVGAALPWTDAYPSKYWVGSALINSFTPSLPAPAGKFAYTVVKLALTPARVLANIDVLLVAGLIVMPISLWNWLERKIVIPAS